ncbi:hypothetical protein [Sphingomonas sp.]|uniref:hypothetical protein n=1 Tax=Sphingomonas sp. TaxID=28214 RepID=UPI001ECF39D1|nr:hypothetical protein [Sphingomonas sp.]MBX3593484.1 hypothetical protein [Sphingomonas sp.]
MTGGRGRPIRFFALVMLGWAGVRTVMLWPAGATLPEAIEEAFPIRAATAAAIDSERPAPIRRPGVARGSPLPAVSMAPAAAATSPAPPRPVADARIGLATLGFVTFGREELLPVLPHAAPYQPAAPTALPDRAQPSRWSASGWFVTRRGAMAGGPMLGGDQVGGRIAFSPADGRFALFARVTAPLVGRGREAAVGVEWHPVRAPARIVVEYRAGLDGTPGGPAAGIVAGVDAIDLPFEFELSAYGQAGAVWRRRVEPYADGAIRVTRDVARAGSARIALGVGAWGAAQRESARLDAGPTAVVTVPLGGHAMRVTIDWRERIAGEARPGSGPALSLGADF